MGRPPNILPSHALHMGLLLLLSCACAPSLSASAAVANDMQRMGSKKRQEEAQKHTVSGMGLGGRHQQKDGDLGQGQESIPLHKGIGVGVKVEGGEGIRAEAPLSPGAQVISDLQWALQTGRWVSSRASLQRMRSRRGHGGGQRDTTSVDDTEDLQRRMKQPQLGVGFLSHWNQPPMQRRSLYYIGWTLASQDQSVYSDDATTLLQVASELSLNPGDLGWDETKPCSSWTGLTCEADIGAVVELRLSGEGLTGTISASFNSLRSLEYLDLSNNQLTGFSASLPFLYVLNLGNNQLTGSIPASLGSMINLMSLFLDSNQLTGSIPDYLASPGTVGWGKTFQWLGLSSNYFSSGCSAVEISSGQFGGEVQTSDCTYNCFQDCLTGLGISPWEIPIQRPSSECDVVCHAQEPYGACSGQGTCSLANSPTGSGICTCNPGYNTATDDFGRCVIISDPTASGFPSIPVVNNSLSLTQGLNLSSMPALFRQHFLNSFSRYLTFGFFVSNFNPGYILPTGSFWLAPASVFKHSSSKVGGVKKGVLYWPNPRDQGSCSACWAQAAVDAASAAFVIASNPYNTSVPQLSTEEVVYCNNYSNSCTPSLPQVALEFLAQRSIATEENPVFQTADSTQVCLRTGNMLSQPMPPSLSLPSLSPPSLSPPSLSPPSLSPPSLSTSSLSPPSLSPPSLSPPSLLQPHLLPPSLSPPSLSPPLSKMPPPVSPLPLPKKHKKNKKQKKRRTGRKMTENAGPIVVMYEQVQYRGWFGLLLVLLHQPALVSLDGSYPLFQQANILCTVKNYVFSDPNCFGELTHTVQVVGFDMNDNTPYWVIRNSWGSSWCQGGYMRIKIQPGTGTCGMHALPALYPIPQPVPGDPCYEKAMAPSLSGAGSQLYAKGPLMPCGGGTCTKMEQWGPLGYACDCSNIGDPESGFIFVAVNNTVDTGSITQACVPVDVCGWSGLNPCGLGTCVNDGEGSYSCICPLGWASDLDAQGSPACSLSFATGVSVKYVVQPQVSCSLIAASYQLTISQLLQQNPKLDCSAPGISSVVSISNPTYKCSTVYNVQPTDQTCDDVKDKITPTGKSAPLKDIIALNPGIDCSNLIPYTMICLKQGDWKDYSYCAAPKPIGIDTTCPGLLAKYWGKHGDNPLDLFTLNPSLQCDNLVPGGLTEAAALASDAQVCTEYPVDINGQLVCGACCILAKTRFRDTCTTLLSNKAYNFQTFSQLAQIATNLPCNKEDNKVAPLPANIGFCHPK